MEKDNFSTLKPRDYAYIQTDGQFFFFFHVAIRNSLRSNKNLSTNNSFELEKGQIHSGITLTVFAMIESPKFHQITKNDKSGIEKRKDRLASRSTAHFFRNTEKRYPYVTTAAAQQQLSSSGAAAAAAAAAAAEAAAAAVVAVEAKAA